MDYIIVFCWYVVGLVIIVTHRAKCNLETEPTCLSRFDYDYKMLQKMVNLEQTIQSLKDSLAESDNKMEVVLRTNEQTIQRLKDSLAETRNTIDSGSVYIRWGKNECQEEADIVYKGYTAGKKYSDKGSGSDTICLPEEPSWFNYSTSNHPRGMVYGAETDVDTSKRVFEKNVNSQDIPCVACHIRKSSVMMIPGRSHCYSGWNLEYAGYLMTAYHANRSPQNHVCVDHHPDFIRGGDRDNNEHILSLTISKCGSLPCPPYVNDRELACVVCSK